MSSARRGRGSKAGGLGRSLLRKQDRRFATSSRHTTDDSGATAPMTSITENTSIDEFLSNAEAAQRSFEAERSSRMVAAAHEGDVEDCSDIDEDDEDSQDSDDSDSEAFFSIPKKPQWSESQSAEEYRRTEQLSFLDWKRAIAKVQKKHPHLPPFEKNLDFWRQLWKMVEISDVVVQVVDARDPMYYYSPDLADYVRQTTDSAREKTNVLLLNKADFLSREQREAWAKYFSESDLNAVFFSATLDDDEASAEDTSPLRCNDPRVFSPSQLLRTLCSMATTAPVTVGFLGYPNVGKSSTINRFLSQKRLQVSATPGKTKHYQTHVLGGEVVLVDGPGLVMPNLHMTKASMVVAGILPIDNLTDYMPPVDEIVANVPLEHLVRHYGIMRNCVTEAKRADSKSQSMQLLSAFGLMRGLMKPGNVPDQARAARVILKDYVQGKLLYCKAPPGTSQEQFCKYDLPEKDELEEDVTELSIEDSFPELRVQSGVHVRGVKRVGLGGPEKKKSNKNKREKARRVYKDAY